MHVEAFKFSYLSLVLYYESNKGNKILGKSIIYSIGPTRELMLEAGKNRSDSRQRRVRYNLSSWNCLPFCVIEEPMADEDFGARNWPFVKLIAEWISCAKAWTLTIQECWHFRSTLLSVLVPFSSQVSSMGTNLANFSRKIIALYSFQ